MQAFRRGLKPAWIRKGCLLALLLMVSAASAKAQCAANGLAVVVNNKSSVVSLSTAQLRRLILGDVRNWPDQKPVTIVARDQSSKVAQCVLSQVVRLSGDEYRRYLMSAEFRGEDPLNPQTANSDAGAARLVATAATSFAVIDAAALPAISGQVKVLRINGKLPGESGYPL